MKRKLAPIDILFLLLESQKTQWHMAGCEIFALPRGAKANFIATLVKELRATAPVFPFNVTLDTSTRWPSWQPAEVDMQHHVRHLVLPAPGDTATLMHAMEGLVAPLLDRNLPLWECWVIEGLDQDRFAIAFKAHHALLDGQGGLNIILNALSRNPRDKTVRALWGDNSDRAAPRPARRKPAANRDARTVLASLGTNLDSLLRSAPDPLAISREIREGARSLLRGETAQRLKDLWPFKASRSRLSQPARSSARRYGIGDLPLSAVKACAKSHGATVNDVLLSVVDDAVHRYLRETGAAMRKPLVIGLPVSVRKPGDNRPGNQAGAVTIALGAPKAAPVERLRSINAATTRAKEQAQQLPAAALMGYGALVLGLPALLERVQGLSAALPMVNLGISNVSPPKGADYLGKKLYLRGAHLQGIYAQPILPPSVLLNVTVGSIEDSLCLGISSTQEAIDDPIRLATYIEEAFAALASAGEDKPKSRATRAKKAVVRRPAPGKRAHNRGKAVKPAKAAPRKTGRKSKEK